MKYQADVADPQAIEQMVGCAVEEFGKLDIAVSNAAFSERELFYRANLEGFPPDDRRHDVGGFQPAAVAARSR